MKIETEIHKHISEWWHIVKIHKHISEWWHIVNEQPDTLHRIIELMYIKGLEDAVKIIPDDYSNIQLKLQLGGAYDIKKRLEGSLAGIGMWRMISRYIDALNWVLDEE